ncbi:hypothetical protein [Mycobacteroides abscessus]|uniref:hypothetical protein n=1 Tax=Mycobacteroides abscessus TaxID=36809 RepID=UPI001F22E4A9|nr:hypothetical protein [Mycobacteroides abscessus]
MNTRDSIRAAMERLLAGTPEHTDGRLTKTNLAYEAGVGRATLYRQHDLTAEWIRRAAAADPTEAPQSNPAVIARLTRQLAEERARRCESDRIAQGLAFDSYLQESGRKEEMTSSYTVAVMSTTGP